MGRETIELLAEITLPWLNPAPTSGFAHRKDLRAIDNNTAAGMNITVAPEPPVWECRPLFRTDRYIRSPFRPSILCGSDDSTLA